VSAIDSPAAIDALVAAINARDLHALDDVFTEDVLMEWPQSGERINGGQNRREIYSRMSTLPTVVPRRISGSGDDWVLEARLDYGDGDPYLVVFIFQMRDGRIAREIAYWSKPFPAPEWRKPWVDRMLMNSRMTRNYESLTPGGKGEPFIQGVKSPSLRLAARPDERRA
jgi:ketosteroid isomerase-like protein